MSKINSRSLLLLLVLTAVFSARLAAQAVSGSINGTVVDPSGAAVPSAKISARNTATNVETTAESTGAGFYNILQLTPGLYIVKAQAPGFRRFSADDIAVNVDSVARLEIKLEIGDVANEVTVTGGATLLQADKTELSTVISEQLVTELPTLGRNMSRLTILLPGALPNTSQLETHVENMVEDFRTAVNGQSYGNTNRQIDGIDNNETIQGSAVIVPSADSIAEVKVITNSYDAEFGQVMAAVVQTVTKSGTNGLHGSAFEFLRNSETFSRNPFTEPLGPAPFRWNQYGGSLGGPIRRDKLFFFGDYQGTQQRLGSGLVSTVPLEAFHRGDFGSLSRNPIFDPLTGDINGRGRAPFAANAIPSNRINPTAQKLFALLPPPTDPSKTDQNYTRSDVVGISTNQVGGRVDYAYSPKTRVFGRYTFFGSSLDVPVLYGDVAGGPAFGPNGYKDATTRSQNLAFNYQRTITPSFLAEARFGFSRFRAYGALRDSALKTADEVGLPGINKGDALTGGLPGLSIAGPVGAFAFGDPASAPFSEIEQSIEFVSNWTKIFSAHTLKWGADIRPARLLRFAQNGRGQLNFNQNASGSADTSASGLGMASFLLGYVQSFTRDLKVDRSDELQTRTGLFISDQWRATRKVTVNYGLRWEFFSPISGNKPGGLTNLDPSTGEVLFSDIGNVNSSAGLHTYNGNFGPRLGIAYTPAPKTVIRTGYGRSFALGTGGSNFGSMSQRWPNTASQDIAAQTLYTAVFPLDQGPPTPPLPLQPPSSGKVLLPDKVGFIGFYFDNRFDYIDAWNFTIQREFARDFAVEVSYVGNVGRRLFWNDSVNAPVPGPGTANPRRPYFGRYGWTQDLTMRGHVGRNSYNSLQSKAQKRFSHSQSVLFAFTWQKALDFGGVSPQNVFNWRIDHGPGDNDRAVFASISHVWELPFRAQGPAGVLVNGWTFDGIIFFASGRPFTPTLSNTASLNSPGVTLRPDRIGGGTVVDPNRDRWFSPSTFTVPALYTYGNSGRNILRGPGIVNVDWSVGKDFRLREGLALKFRAEAYNLFNRANLGQPVATVDTSTAGRILGLFPGYNMRRMQFGLHLLW